VISLPAQHPLNSVNAGQAEPPATLLPDILRGGGTGCRGQSQVKRLLDLNSHGLQGNTILYATSARFLNRRRRNGRKMETYSDLLKHRDPVQ